MDYSMDYSDDAADLKHRTSRLALKLSQSTQTKLSELLSEGDEKVASVLKRGLALYGHGVEPDGKSS